MYWGRNISINVADTISSSEYSNGSHTSKCHKSKQKEKLEKQVSKDYKK